MAATQAAQLVLGELACLFLVIPPQVQEPQEVGIPVGELAVGLVGLCLRLVRALAGVLDAQAAGDDQHLRQAVPRLGRKHHASDAGIGRQARQPPAEPGERTAGLDRPQLLEELVTGLDLARIRRLQEREVLRRTEMQGSELQDQGREAHAQDLGIGVLGPRAIVVLGIEPDAHPRALPATAPLALIGRRP